MKKTEQIIAACITVALGVLIIVLRGGLLDVLTTVIGITLCVLGVLDFLHKRVPPAIVKIVSGIVVLICGLTIVEIVLYVIAALLLIGGLLTFYAKWKALGKCATWQERLLEYAAPTLAVFMGILLLFNQGKTLNWMFIVCGILTVIEGAVIFVNALRRD